MLGVVPNTFATLFVAIDPLGPLPVLLALTAGTEPARRRRVAVHGTLTGGGVLLGFALLGDGLLDLPAPDPARPGSSKRGCTGNAGSEERYRAAR